MRFIFPALVALCIHFATQNLLAQSSFPCVCDGPTCCSQNWIDINYISFWNDGYATPALVTQSPAGTPQTDAGVLGSPNTSTLLGSDNLGDNTLSGFRIDFGRWLNCDTALTGGFFFLNGDSSDTFPAGGDGIVSRPFFNVAPGQNAQDSELVNFPGQVSGTTTVDSNTDIFSGNVGLQRKIYCCDDDSCCSGRRLDAYLGYRAFSFDEELVIREQLNPNSTSGFFPAGTQIDLTDRFATENSFHGVEFGLLHTWQKQRWVFEASTRVALGNIRQRVIIDGSTVTTVPGNDPFVQPYGLLAAPSNIGEYERDRFGVLTDTRLEIGYWVSCRWKLQAGYNLLFLNSVVRPGPHIDTTLNTTQIDPLVTDAGPARPRFDWNDESLLLHGLNVGAEFRF